jgi:glycosyltransferase involved in cell wall biosynthesis
MKIAITSNIALPVEKYGGAERVIWQLSQTLSFLGHDVTLIAPPGSKCEFCDIINFDFKSDIRELVENRFDVVHFNTKHKELMDFPHIFRIGGNPAFGEELSPQTVFVSQNQANRYGAVCFIHNGYSMSNFDFSTKKVAFHFLGKAAWRRKNVRGAILCAKKANRTPIDILGGTRLNFNMGFRFTTDLHARFHGMVDDDFKNQIMLSSKGLVFPVRWNDPCPNAVIESLFAGCPVFGTPYGSLPELVPAEVGFLSASSDELAEAMKESANWKPQNCRDYAMESFNSKKMALSYLEIYERVIEGEVLNRNNPTLQKPEPKLLPFE